MSGENLRATLVQPACLAGIDFAESGLSTISSHTRGTQVYLLIQKCTLIAWESDELTTPVRPVRSSIG